MKPNLDLSNQQTQTICDILTQLLSDLYTLALKYQYFHWNVEGDSFMTWHQVSEAHYGELFEYIDLISEFFSKIFTVCKIKSPKSHTFRSVSFC